MPNRDEQQHGSPRDVPPVSRPRGAVWRSLQADGVVWEGQVLLVGDDVDLAARMIVTYRRVVFVRGGEVGLEMLAMRADAEVGRNRAHARADEIARRSQQPLGDPDLGSGH